MSFLSSCSTISISYPSFLSFVLIPPFLCLTFFAIFHPIFLSSSPNFLSRPSFLTYDPIQSILLFLPSSHLNGSFLNSMLLSGLSFYVLPSLSPSFLSNQNIFPLQNLYFLICSPIIFFMPKHLSSKFYTSFPPSFLPLHHLFLFPAFLPVCPNIIPSFKLSILSSSLLVYNSLLPFISSL